MQQLRNTLGFILNIHITMVTLDFGKDHSTLEPTQFWLSIITDWKPKVNQVTGKLEPSPLYTAEPTTDDQEHCSIVCISLVTYFV